MKRIAKEIRAMAVADPVSEKWWVMLYTTLLIVGFVIAFGVIK